MFVVQKIMSSTGSRPTNKMRINATCVRQGRHTLDEEQIDDINIIISHISNVREFKRFYMSVIFI